MKRSAEEDNSSPTTEKRPLVADKIAAAAEVAARLNRKLAGSQPTMNVGAPVTQNPYQQPAVQLLTRESSIPDRYVGLMIGRKGEQITQLQSESGCKIQISQAGTPERTVTITGTEMQIEHAKQLISELIDRGDKNGPVSQSQSSYQGSNNTTTVEILIPGMKAGLIIGKSGETIKSLQEEHGVKMVLVQESNSPTAEDKPLRITGEPGRVENAKQAVLNLVNQRDRDGPMYGYGGQETSQYPVPAEKAGLVIGKGGESIKEICRVSGARVEISKDPSPDQSTKIFNVRGSKQEIDQAIRMISERADIPVTRPTSGGASGQRNQYDYPQSEAGISCFSVSAQPRPGLPQHLRETGFTDPWGGNATNGNGHGVSAAAMPQPTLNPYTGQPDYSSAWAEYYRRQGMHDHADAILRQAQQPQAYGMQQAAQVTPTNMVPQTPAAAPVQVQGQAAAPQGYDYNQWQQWQAWQQQAWQQQGGAPGQPAGGGYAPHQQAMQNPGAGHPPMPQQ